jgi:hypothetical protein
MWYCRRNKDGTRKLTSYKESSALPKKSAEKKQPVVIDENWLDDLSAKE